MIHEHRFFATHSLTGEILGEVPLDDVTVTDRLRAPSTLGATIAYRDPAARLLSTELVDLVATRDALVIFAGPLLDIRLGEGTPTLQLQCEDVWNTVQRRLIRSRQGMTYATGAAAGTITFSGVDQFRIVADLIAHIQSISGGDLGIVVAWTALSGVTRDRTYLDVDAKFAGEAIEQLANVEGGFDWTLETSGTEDAIVRTLRLSPLAGRDTSYLLDWTADGEGHFGGDQILGVSLGESSRGRVQRVYGTGKDIVSSAEDPNLLGHMRLTESTRAWMDVSVQSTLNAHTARELALNKQPTKVVGFTLNPDVEPQWGELVLGDRVNVAVDDGWAQISGVQRVVSRSLNIPASGAATSTLELAPYGRFV